MRKEPEIPPSIPKALYTLLLIAGIVLLVFWYSVYLIPRGIYFDVGLYAVVAMLIGFGLVGRLLYGAIEREEEEG
jgi:hypothetical protein